MLELAFFIPAMLKNLCSCFLGLQDISSLYFPLFYGLINLFLMNKEGLRFCKFCLLLTVLLVFLIQNGVTSSIKPQQVTYIVPGIDNFDQTEISNFIQKAQDNLVSSSYLNNV